MNKVKNFTRMSNLPHVMFWGILLAQVFSLERLTHFTIFTFIMILSTCIYCTSNHYWLKNDWMHHMSILLVENKIWANISPWLLIYGYLPVVSSSLNFTENTKLHRTGSFPLGRSTISQLLLFFKSIHYLFLGLSPLWLGNSLKDTTWVRYITQEVAKTLNIGDKES